jgi:hypothetical protein
MFDHICLFACILLTKFVCLYLFDHSLFAWLYLFYHVCLYGCRLAQEKAIRLEELLDISMEVYNGSYGACFLANDHQAK